MNYYRVTAYYYKEDESTDKEPHKFTDRISASGAEEAALWTENHLRTEVGVTLTGDIEVCPPGQDEPELFPV
jgi:hypothetical protein